MAGLRFVEVGQVWKCSGDTGTRPVVAVQSHAYDRSRPGTRIVLGSRVDKPASRPIHRTGVSLQRMVRAPEKLREVMRCDVPVMMLSHSPSSPWHHPLYVPLMDGTHMPVILTKIDQDDVFRFLLRVADLDGTPMTAKDVGGGVMKVGGLSLLSVAAHLPGVP